MLGRRALQGAVVLTALLCNGCDVLCRDRASHSAGGPVDLLEPRERHAQDERRLPHEDLYSHHTSACCERRRRRRRRRRGGGEKEERRRREGGEETNRGVGRLEGEV